MRAAWTELGQMTIVAATGGSATTVVDTATRFTTDDALVNGTALVISTTDGLTPQGKFSRISDFVASTYTFTIDTVTDAIAAGDVIGLARPTIPHLHMKQAVNDALKDHIGTMSKVDVTLTSASDDATYTLPAGMFIKRLIDVQIDDGSDYYTSILSKVEILPTTTGAQMLSHDLESGQNIKIIYEGLHPELTIYSSYVHESIPIALLTDGTVQKALEWLVSKRGDSALGTFLLQRKNEAEQKIANAKVEHPVNRVRKAARWFV